MITQHAMIHESSFSMCKTGFVSHACVYVLRHTRVRLLIYASNKLTYKTDIQTDNVICRDGHRLKISTWSWVYGCWSHVMRVWNMYVHSLNYTLYIHSFTTLHQYVHSLHNITSIYSFTTLHYINTFIHYITPINSLNKLH